MKILVVDDDAELRELIRFALQQAGYFVITADDGPSAIASFESESPSLVVLDVNLPGFDGLEVCRRIRQQSVTPILVLTVRDGEEDEVRALDLGADDYLTKPFSPRTLLARLRALLRRSSEALPRLVSGEFSLDVERSSVTIRGGEARRLTVLELRLLQILLAHAGRTVSTERLLHHVWGRDGEDRQLLKQLVRRLRQRLEDDPSVPRYLLTESGEGYRLVTGAAGT